MSHRIRHTKLHLKNVIFIIIHRKIFELLPSEQVEIRDLSARGQNGKNFIKQLVHDPSINTCII